MTEIIQKVKNLSIGFKSKKGEEILILRNITTNIKKGETVGIVGESGSRSRLSNNTNGFTFFNICSYVS